MKLIDDWKKAHKFLSIWAMAFAGVWQTTWTTLPDDMKAVAPQWMHSAGLYLCLALGITGRLVKQGGKDASVPPQ